MTQGYGPEHGQQPQWGQASPAEPQWGQASPPAAPGGYPGAAGQPGMGTGPQFGPGDGVNWKRVRLFGLILLIGAAVLLLLRLGINLSMFIGAADIAATNTGGDPGATAIGSSLALLVLYPTNWFVGIVLLTLGIIAAVMGRGRARVGGIIVAVAIPLSVILYWILNIVVGFLLVGIGVTDPSAGLTATSYRISAGIDALHSIAIAATVGLGAFFVFSTATKKLSA